MKNLSVVIVLSIFLLCGCNSNSTVNKEADNTDVINDNINTTNNELSKDVSSNNVYEVNKYISYINDDGLFKVTLFIQDGIHTSKEHIDIFSTVEYIGDDDEVEIWHGIPYFKYKIFDGENYYCEGINLDILMKTVLEKGKVYTIPFIKAGAWSEDADDSEYWEKYYKDKELKLPVGEYSLAAYCDFSLSECGSHYDNKVEIKFEVE
ncbi:hypothetical protein SH1V18_47610 [Vallitalea longa]|uniref:Uncharacterized protein n=1 Tax=Vallitalea longa TaxID=2936439 RepID=A0A9W6DGG6_9FIRM|nr:hypothetical protein [Vallitalea longa]GKX32281.1 hypothetical protein SH1V18_47610 [Vallitalea longa]